MKKIFSLTSLMFMGLLLSSQEGKAPSSPKKEKILSQEEKSVVLKNKNKFRQHFQHFSTSNTTFDLYMNNELEEFLNANVHRNYYRTFLCKNKNFVGGFNFEGCAVKIFETPSPSIFFKTKIKPNCLNKKNAEDRMRYLGYCGTYTGPINSLYRRNDFNAYDDIEEIDDILEIEFLASEPLVKLVFKERESFLLRSKTILEKMKQVPQGEDLYVYLQKSKKVKQALDLKKGVLVLSQIFLKFVEIFVNDGELCFLEEEKANGRNVEALEKIIEGFDVVKTMHLVLHSQFLALDFQNSSKKPLSTKEFMEQTAKMKEDPDYEEKNKKNIQLLQQKAKEALTLKEYNYLVSFLSQDVQQINFHAMIDGLASRLPYSIANLFKLISLKVFPVFLGVQNHLLYLNKPENSSYVHPSFRTNFPIDKEFYSPKAALCVNSENIFLFADQEERNFMEELGKQMFSHVQLSFRINDISNYVATDQRMLFQECIEETAIYNDLFVFYVIMNKESNNNKLNLKALCQERNYTPTKERAKAIIEKYVLFRNMKSVFSFPLLFKIMAAGHSKRFDILTEDFGNIFVHTRELVQRIFYIYDENQVIKNYVVTELLFSADIAYDIIYKNTDSNKKYSKSLEDLVKDL